MITASTQPPAGALLRPRGTIHATITPRALAARLVGPSCRRTRRASKQQPHDKLVPVAAAASSQQGPTSPDEPPQHSSRLSEGGRQLLGVTALAFFTLLAAVAKERATSPIVPPLLPTIHTLASTSPAAGSALQPIVLTHTPTAASGVLTAEGSAGAQRSSGPVRASKALLRTLWGTAVGPAKLVDALVFPDVDIVRPKAAEAAPAAAEPVKLVSTPAAAPAPAPVAPAVVVAAPVPAPGTAATTTSIAIVPDARAAAAGQALHALGQQLQALAGQLSAGSEGLLGQLQQAASACAAGIGGGQTATAAAAEDAGSAAQEEDVAQGTSPSPAAADAADAAGDQSAAALLLLRTLLGSDAMSLLPVLLVTCATAAAGLTLAAAMAGAAGLVDRRRATTPAQRAAQAALLDSPVRPIACPSWPAAMHYLPSDLAISYRWREGEGGGAASSGGSERSSSKPERAADSSASSSSVAATVDATLLSAAAKALEGTQWSFSQISAYRHYAQLRQPSSRGGVSIDKSSSSSKPCRDAAPVAGDIYQASSSSRMSTSGDEANGNDSYDDDVCHDSVSSYNDQPEERSSSEQGSKTAAAGGLEYGTMQAAAAAGGDAPAAAAGLYLPNGLELGSSAWYALYIKHVNSDAWQYDYDAVGQEPRSSKGSAAPAASGRKQASAPAAAAASKGSKVAAAKRAQAAAAAKRGSKPAASAAKGDRAPAAAGKGAADQADSVLASVRQLLGLPATAANAAAAASADDSVLSNRLVLLICQAMLQRGDERQLRAVVQFLATDSTTVSRSVRRQMPVMLAGCLEAMFAGEDWDRPGSRVWAVMASLEAALPAGSYSRLQRLLMAKGLGGVEPVDDFNCEEGCGFQ